MMEFLSDIARQFEWIDVLDVLLVALVLYILLSWIRGSVPESASRRIIVAAPIAAAIYLLIRVFDLFLLEIVVQYLFVVVLIAAVVVFQSDIRRMMDRIVSSRRNRENAATADATTVDTLASTVADLAEKHVGALIAIRGREPLDSHVHGGVQLGGVITQPLLQGIFDPDTPGHDGAVIIEDDRVAMFAAHLPLTAALPEVSRHGGTRHAAALGLAEESDALVIVVSEERGTISIAQDGTLTEDVNISKLKQRLESFWNSHYREMDYGAPSWWKRPNLQTAAVAAIVAVLLWLFVVYSPDTVLRTLSVPIEFRNMPNGWTLNGDVPSHAEVVLTGPEQVFRRLDAEGLAVSIDMSSPQSGIREFVIAEEDLNLPAGIELTRVEPQVIRVDVHRLRSVRVPVHVPLTGSLPDSLRLISIRVEPDSVTLHMGEGPVPRSAQTEQIDISSIREDATLTTRLIVPETAQVPSGAANELTVRIDVSEAPDTSGRSPDENGAG